MTEKGKLFFEKLSKDAKLKAELAAMIKDAYLDKAVAFAKANGFDIEKADISADKEELDPKELEMVTGGVGTEGIANICLDAGSSPRKRDEESGCNFIGIVG